MGNDKIITLRDDLKFDDEYKIDSHVFEYSLKMYYYYVKDLDNQIKIKNLLIDIISQKVFYFQ